jgi:hypothetical protein
MMTLDAARNEYYSHSGSASAAARQLAFAGIAVVWILATNEDVVVVQPESLRLPLLAFVATLAFDLVHYYWQASFWGIFHRMKEKKGELEFEGAPSWGNWIGLGCWVLKGATVAIGYYLLAVLLWPVLFSGAQ